MKKILITGASGLLGSNLAYSYRKKYEITGAYNTHTVSFDCAQTSRLDLLDLKSVQVLINKFRPDVVIHCAALTDVDKCEDDKELAYRLNVEATNNIVTALGEIRSQFIYISTDSVYDGIKGNFKEDETNPVNYYGQTKLLGEGVASAYLNTLILRTNFFGWNFQEKFSIAEWIFNTLQKKEPLNAFFDAIFSPLYVRFIAEIIELAITSNFAGIFNLGSSNSLSKYDFAVYLSRIFQLNRMAINSISIDDFPFKAKRGKNLSLDVTKIQKALNLKSQTIEESVLEFHQDYLNGLQKDMRSLNYDFQNRQ